MFRTNSFTALVVVVVVAMSAAGANATGAGLRGGRALGQVMCPQSEPTSGAQCNSNQGEACKYDNNVLNFNNYDTQCDCLAEVGNDNGNYEWSCQEIGSSTHQVMCPMNEPKTGVSCTSNQGETCDYDNGVLNFSNYDTQCSCDAIVWNNKATWEWSCEDVSDSHEVMCPMEPPVSGTQCNSNKGETCNFNNDNTQCACQAMVGNSDGDYEWTCNETCPADPIDEQGHAKECFYEGQECKDYACGPCMCEALLGSETGQMVWSCENVNCHN